MGAAGFLIVTLLAVTHPAPPHFSLTPLLHPKRQSLLNTDRGVAVCLRHSLQRIFRLFPLHPRAAVFTASFVAHRLLGCNHLCGPRLGCRSLVLLLRHPPRLPCSPISEAHRILPLPYWDDNFALCHAGGARHTGLPHQHHQANGRILLRFVMSRRHGFFPALPAPPWFATKE